MRRLRPLLLLGLAGATAAAAAPPRFVADEPTDAALARRAWAAAESCTGWTAPSHDPVRIARGDLVDGYDGRAYLDDDGLHRIVVAGPRPDRSLVHELAHAWAWRGPSALTEGRTDLLADCIAERLTAPDLLDPDDSRDLDHLPDLRRWSNPRTRHGAGGLEADRADAYLGAARLMRVAATVLGDQVDTLWPRDGTLRWRDLEERLLDQGPSGALVVDALQGGAERQREALTDRDGDGQPWLAEILDGTDPDRWDSDGDGWWDGAPPVPVGAVPLPRDGSAVCAGVASGPLGARIQVRYRAARAAASPPVRVVAGDVWIVDDPARGVAVPPSTPVLLAVDGGWSRGAGGAWAMVGGQGLGPSWNCRSTPRYTVWVADPRAAAAMATFEAHLDEHLHRAEGLLGRTDARLVVALGTGALRSTADGVQLSTGLLDWAREHDRLDALAGLAVALHRTRLAPVDARRWDTAEALTRALVDAPPELLFVAVDEADPRARAAEADRCGEGWRGMVDGACGPR